MKRFEKGQTLFIALAALVIGAIFVLVLSMTIVQPGNVKIEKCFGRLTGATFHEGTSFKKPWCGAVNYRTKITSYETSDHPNESKADYTDFTIDAQTTDGQQIKIKFTTLFRIDPENAADINRNIGSMKDVVENIVKAYSRSNARTIAQNYSAEVLYSGAVDDYANEVLETLQTECSPHFIIITDFLVRKIVFDEDYIASIERQQIAEENIQTEAYNADAAVHLKEQAIQQAQGEAEASRQMALAEADNKIALANANAEAQIILAQAEAEAIALRGEALAQYPEVLQLNFIEQMENVNFAFLPSDGLTPFLPLPTP